LLAPNALGDGREEHRGKKKKRGEGGPFPAQSQENGECFQGGGKGQKKKKKDKGFPFNAGAAAPMGTVQKTSGGKTTQGGPNKRSKIATGRSRTHKDPSMPKHGSNVEQKKGKKTPKKKGW